MEGVYQKKNIIAYDQKPTRHIPQGRRSQNTESRRATRHHKKVSLLATQLLESMEGTLQGGDVF